jgi:hypothetical protein
MLKSSKSLLLQSNSKWNPDGLDYDEPQKDSDSHKGQEKQEAICSINKNDSSESSECESVEDNFSQNSAEIEKPS